MPDRIDTLLEEQRLTRADVVTLTGKVEGHLAHCHAVHQRVDEIFKEDRRRIISLEENAQANREEHATAKGGWKGIAALGAAVAAGAGLIGTIWKLWPTGG